jgi:hypothetical protein
MNILYNGSNSCDDFEWEDVGYFLTELMNKKNPSGFWKATVNNFGWRNLDGYKFFEAATGHELLQNILPDTECTFNIANFRNGILIQNYHHDSPTGNEKYYILPVAESTYYKNNY